MKAFVFTLDSFVALVLVLFAISAMLYISNSPKSASEDYSRLYMVADDSLDVLAKVNASAVSGTDESALLMVGRLASSGDLKAAGRVVQGSIEPVIPGQFGFSVEYEKRPGEWVLVYSRERPQNSMRASAVRIVSGEKNPGKSGTWCADEKCALCSGLPPGSVEGESFGPFAIRINVWV